MSTSASHETIVSERMSFQKFKCQVSKNTNTIVTQCHLQTVKLKSNFCSTLLGYKLNKPFTYNVLRLGALFYLGFGAQSCRKKYCNKINQISTENYIAIFLFAQTFCELQSKLTYFPPQIIHCAKPLLGVVYFSTVVNIAFNFSSFSVCCPVCLLSALKMLISPSFANCTSPKNSRSRD